MTQVYHGLIHEIAQLCQNFGVGTLQGPESSRTIFVGELGREALQGVYLIEVASPPPHQYIDRETPIIDFWARSPNSDQAHALLELVYNSFHRKYGYDTANWHISFSQALGNIIDAGRDANGGKLYRLSVQFICRNLNNVS